MKSELNCTDVNLLVGKRILKKRKEQGYTGKQMANYLGISQQQFSRYERGLNRIDLYYLVSLAIYLKTPIHWFFEDCFEASPVRERMVRRLEYSDKYTAESVLDISTH